MRTRALLAIAAMAIASLTTLPALAGSTADECPEGTFLAKYEVDTNVRLDEGTDVLDVTVTETNEDGEVLSFTWSSSEPIAQFAVKAGKDTTVVPAGDATSGSFTVPDKFAVSHITMCLGEDAPEITPDGKPRFICWGQDADSFYAIFAYNNTSTDETGTNVAVDRALAGFGTNRGDLEGAFPTTFDPTGDDSFGSAIQFTVDGWDGVGDLTFELFGITKVANVNNQSQECYDI